VLLKLPGRARIGGWEVRAELHPGPIQPAGPDLETLDAEALSGTIEVRTWREGDRIRPLGMGGTKTLGDLFTDRGVPRTLRRAIPVVTVDGRVAWVAGVAVSEDFRLDPAAERVAVLTARVLE
jgi:tRNA(Ile)-lysidine synthase